MIGKLILRGNGHQATTIKICRDTQVAKEPCTNLETYEINQPEAPQEKVEEMEVRIISTKVNEL